MSQLAVDSNFFVKFAAFCPVSPILKPPEFVTNSVKRASYIKCLPLLYWAVLETRSVP